MVMLGKIRFINVPDFGTNYNLDEQIPSLKAFELQIE